MFKLFVKLMILLVVLALAGPFFIKGPDGGPLIGLDDVRRQLNDAGAGMTRSWNKLKTRFGPDADPLPVYRWQDEEGNWHYSDIANPNGPSELIYVDPDQNVVPASDAFGAPDAPASRQLPGGITELLDDAHEAKQSIEDRDEQIRQKTRDEK